MKLTAAFLKIIRWPNLVFIALTQVMFFYCIAVPALHAAGLKPILSNGMLALLTFSSLLGAAGGNIINDYFDLNIDKINKPEKVIVEKYISRRWIIFWHLLLSVASIIIGIYISYKTRILWIAFANLSCVVLLFLYSVSLKKKFLVGNILVSALSAWLIMVVSLIEFSVFIHVSSTDFFALRKIMRLGILYTCFAFVISLVREVVKDMEDMEGDRRYGCTTMPIVWGVNAAKVFVAVWLIVLIAALVILQLYAVTFGWWISIFYSVILIIAPLVYIFRQLFAAYSPQQFHSLSSVIKLVMFTGIVSMLFFYF
ncbi:MAG: ubiquinone biosynthesis protein UbiA [Chitinophaga sp.]|nr:ubiquinone biosynthesis protein UbiA [Chitinophaga sp.]